MTFRLILSVSKDAHREVGFLLETGVNHICKINYPGKIPATAGWFKGLINLDGLAKSQNLCF